jgi:nucleoside-diphosphate-sugar epimerase
LTYFVTGATGFIGRHLVERLLQRDGDIHVLVREGSTDKLDALIERWGPAARERIKPVVGDLGQPMLGVDPGSLTGKVDHFFHLAAIYDMTADDERNEQLNVAGTRHAVELANAVQAGRLHHTSSIAAAGNHKGLFREDHFDEGQELPSAYHRTKFESEKIARNESTRPWRVYRPAIVVGHSKTGEMDKIDGPYYFFKLIQKLRGWLPSGSPSSAPSSAGRTSSRRLRRRGDGPHRPPARPRRPGVPPDQPAPPAHRRGLNIFAEAAHAPQLQLRVDQKILANLPKGTLSLLMKAPPLKDARRRDPQRLRIPDEVIEHVGPAPGVRHARHRARAEGHGHRRPALEDYGWRLWDYWERHLDPDLFKDRSFEGAVNGKRVLITGASSGIGQAAAMKIAKAGGIPLLVRPRREKLEASRPRSSEQGGTAYVLLRRPLRPRVDRRARRDDPRRAPGRRHPRQQRGPSIRRSIALSYDRFHDFERTMQLNYFGAIRLTMACSRTCASASPATSSTSRRSARRRTRRGSAPTWPRRRPSTRGRASSARRRSATTSTSRRSTCSSSRRR